MIKYAATQKGRSPPWAKRIRQPRRTDFAEQIDGSFRRRCIRMRNCQFIKQSIVIMTFDIIDKTTDDIYILL